MRALLLLPVVAAMNIVSERAALRPLLQQNISRPPICPDLLPLCGNGVIDKKNYSHSKIIPGRTITLAIDEVCDDGNNLDGDGCSADCMDMDSWVSSCELRVDMKRVYEDVAFDENGTMFYSSANGIYEVHPTLSHMASTLVVPKTVAVANMYVKGGVFWLWSPSTAAVWKAEGGSVVKAYETGLQTTSYGGLFWQDGSGLLLLCHDNDGASILNLDTGIKKHYAGALGPVDFILWTGGGFSMVMADGSKAGIWNDQFRYDSAATTNNFWTDAINMLGTSVAILKITPHPMDLVLEPPDISLQGVFTTGFEYTTPWAAGNTLASLHSLCTGSNDFKFIGMGNTIVLHDVWQQPDCSGKCMLDLPIATDVLQKGVSATGRTYYDALKDMLGDTDIRTPYNSNVTNAFAALRSLAKSSSPKLKSVKHPLTQSVFVWRGDSMYEMSKTGTGVEFQDGTCLVSGMAPCGPCMWAVAGTKCQPCSTKANTWAWTVQCQGCSVGRRLLQDGTSKVAFTVQAPLANVSALWPQAVARGSFVDVTITTSDPPATLRTTKDQLAQSGFFVATQPRVIYNPATYTPTPTSAPSESTVTIGAAAVGGVAILGVVVVYFGFLA